MPKLWADNLESHRQDVREAILDATAAIVTENGPTSVAMSAIAERAGITRATLYKYFRDVKTIFLALQERQVNANLVELARARDGMGDAVQKLERLLSTYARLVHEQHSSELVGLLRQGDTAGEGYRKLTSMLRDAIVEGVAARRIRGDVPPKELASFCIRALEAASGTSAAGVQRLVSVTLAGLRPPR